MGENRVLTPDEVRTTEFMVYEEKGSKQLYPTVIVGNRICVADEWDNLDGTDASLYGRLYRFWAHYPTPAELLSNPWPA